MKFIDNLKESRSGAIYNKTAFVGLEFCVDFHWWLIIDGFNCLLHYYLKYFRAISPWLLPQMSFKIKFCTHNFWRAYNWTHCWQNDVLPKEKPCLHIIWQTIKTYFYIYIPFLLFVRSKEVGNLCLTKIKFIFLIFTHSLHVFDVIDLRAQELFKRQHRWTSVRLCLSVKIVNPLSCIAP